MSNPDPHFDPKNVRVADYKYAPKKDSVAAKKKAMSRKMSLVDELKGLVKESERLRKHPFDFRRTLPPRSKGRSDVGQNKHYPHVKYQDFGDEDGRNERDSISGHQRF